MSALCNIPGCDNELLPRSNLKACSNCRASMGMWKKRGVKAILVRRGKLKKYDSRMETLVPDRKVKT